MKHRNFIISILMLIVPLLGWAQEFNVNGIQYEGMGNAKVKVTALPDDQCYSGDIIIPATVVYNGITYNVTEIANGAFANCPDLSSVNLSEGLLMINTNAFGSSGLTSIHIPSTAKFDNEAFIANPFQGCSNLETITVAPANENFTLIDGVLYNKNVTQLWKYPAKKNGSSFSIPATVTIIDYSACEGALFTSVDLSNVQMIKSRGFAESHLTSVEIPASMTSIQDATSFDCEQLTAYTVAEGNTKYSAADGILYSGTTLKSCPQGKTKATILAGTTYLDYSAFYKCRNITTITCNATTPPTATSNNFSSLSKEEVKIFVPTVEAYKAANGWKDFTYITEAKKTFADANNVWYEVTTEEDAITETVKIIPNPAEKPYTGTTLTIPATVKNGGAAPEYTVTAIADDAFGSLATLTSVTCMITDPTAITIGTNALPALPNDTLFVPNLSMDTYRDAASWTALFGNIYGIEEYDITLTSVDATQGSISGLEERKYHYGEEITLIAAPASGYKFVNWTVNGTAVATTATYKFEVEEALELTANFEEKTEPTPPPYIPSYFTITLPETEGVELSRNPGDYTIEEGNSFRFNLTLLEGYEHSVPVVKADGKVVEPRKSDGMYVIYNIWNDMTITIEGIVKDDPTSIDPAASGISVRTSASMLYITTPAEETVRIFTTRGTLQKQLKVSGDAQVQLPAGVYLVRIEDKTYKVVIR